MGEAAGHSHVMPSAPENGAPLIGPLPSLLTSQRPPLEDKASAEESLAESEVEQEQSQDYIYFGVDLKPVLPVGLAVSAVVRSQ